jgi:predicted transcriptional regulator
MKNRDRMEIISRILQAANGRNGGVVGATRTRIMYMAFLTHVQLKQYLSVLSDNGMVKYDSVTQTFKTTEKGHGFLKSYSEIAQMLKVPQQYWVQNYLGEEESLVLKTPQQPQQQLSA